MRRLPPRKIIVNVSVNDDVQLKKAENAWKPGMKKENVTDDPEALKTQVWSSVLLFEKFTVKEALQEMHI